MHRFLFIALGLIVSGVGIPFAAFAQDPAGAAGGNVVLTAPFASVEVLQFSADGKTLYAGLGLVHDKSEEEGYVVVYDLEKKQQTARFSEQRQGIKDFAIVPGKTGHLLFADARDEIEEWDMTKSPPVQVAKVEASGIVNGIDYTPDGKSLVIGEVFRIFVKPTDDLSAKGRDLTGKEVVTQAMDISPDGKYIASVTGDAVVMVYDLADGSVKSQFNANFGGGFSVAFSPSANVVAYQDEENDETIAFGDVESGKIVGRLQLPESSNPGGSGIGGVTITNLVFSPDGKLLLAGGTNGDAYLYEVATGKLIKQILDHKKRDNEGVGMAALMQGNVAGVAFSPDSTTFATGAGDSTIRVYDVATVMKSGGQVAATGPGIGNPEPGVGEPAEPEEFPIRTWKTADGKHSIQATLVGVTDGVAKLKREDGQDANVPVKMLSAADKAYLQKAAGEAEPEPTFPLRFWTTADGKSRIKASYVSSTADAVTILREDGATATVPLNILHERDKRYIASLNE